MTDNRQLLFIIVFLSAFGFFLAGLGVIDTFALFDPLTLVGLSVTLVAAIVASSTPIIKGAATAAFFAILISSIFGSFFDAVDPLIFGLILVPLSIIAGTIMMNLGKS